MRHLSFRTRTTIFASLVVGLIAMFGFGVFVYYTYSQHKESLIERVRITGEAHTIALSDALWAKNHDQMKKVMGNFRRDPDFLGAAIYDEKNKLILSYGKIDNVQGDMSFSKSMYRMHKGSYKNIGKLEIFISARKVKESMWDLVSMGMTFVAIIILLLIFSIILTLRLATNNLEKIIVAMDKYASGDKDVILPEVRSNDEIGKLVKAFTSMKAEMDNFQSSLEQKVSARTSELEKAKQVAETANDAKSRFISAVSHELRTPLSSIIGFSGMISQEVFGPIDNPQYSEYLHNINESAEHLMKVINDLLDLSKAEACRLELENIDFNVRKIFDKTKAIFTVSALDRDIELKLDVDESVPQVLVGDPVRIKQILINLVGNAMKFTHHGTVSISAKYAEEASRLDIEISDTGVGIPEDKIGTIFQQFSQSDVSTYRKFGGTGLGLAITKTLVELMKGTIEVESKVGAGTKFKLYLILDKRLDNKAEAEIAAPELK